MTNEGSRLRVAVDVTPRLFRDALTRVLEHHHVQVVTLPDSGVPPQDDRLDVVVTSADDTGQFPVDAVVVELRHRPAANDRTTGSADESPDAIVSLDDLMAVIDRVCSPGEPPAG